MEKVVYKKCAGVYIFTNKINGKVYIGESLDIRHRMSQYKSPGPDRAFERALIKYGMDGFALELDYLPDFKKEDLLDLEEALIKRFKSLTTQHGYNVASRGKNTSGHKLSEETKRRMSLCKMGDKNPNYGKPLSDETKAKMSIAFSGSNNPNFGKPISDKQKQQISAAKKGKPLSLEIKEKMRLSQTGKVLSEETKEKISRANVGRKRSEEIKAKMRKPKSEKAKENMRLARLAKKIPDEIKKQRKREYNRKRRLAKKRPNSLN